MFDENKFYFISHEKSKELSYHQHIWKNYKSENETNNDNEILLNVLSIDKDSNTIIYEDIVEPYSLSLQDLLV